MPHQWEEDEHTPVVIYADQKRAAEQRLSAQAQYARLEHRLARMERRTDQLVAWIQRVFFRGKKN